MPDLFSKVSEILSNPEASQKIREIASSLSQSEQASAPFPEEETAALPSAETVAPPSESPLFPLGGLSSGFSAHSREMALLNAVRPYLRASRAGKIDNAIKAIRVIDMLSGLR